MNLPHVKKPCKNCPFRIDTLKGWLGRNRMEEILASPSFVCHKNRELQCAGHMLINGRFNNFFDLAQKLGIKIHLTGDNLIFDSKQDCIEHHTK